MNNDEVDVNGNQPDAGGGAAASISNSSLKFRDYSTQPRPNKIINDFITTPSHHHNPHHHKPPANGDSAQNQDHNVQHHPVSQPNHHRPQHAKTLMRWAVRKPDHDSQSPKGVQTLSGTLPPRPVPLANDSNHHPVYNHERLEHAKGIPKSPVISRFREVDTSPGSVESQLVNTESVPLSHHSTQPSPIIAEAAAEANAERVSSHEVVNDGFFKAKSHEQQPVKAKAHKKSRHGLGRVIKVFVTVVIIVGLLATAGWVAYTKVPGVGVRIASIRSGINVTAPSFTPAGFVYKSPVKYYKNLATITYSSKAANQTYYVAEQTTNWDNQAVLNNVVLINNYAYQTIKKSGLTIYVYGPSNASWVNGALLNTIYGNAKLSAQQLARIATSI
ncbi:MAG TPA: hypothetical protein VMR18_03705 [Candidatus Saccharimonadales bacterium]|nr:hypothetical protein [Candidatus Saccharimonadales bacterium]